nr:hypothetical protein MmNV_41 [Menippe mercenaria nudivirus]
MQTPLYHRRRGSTTLSLSVAMPTETVTDVLPWDRQKIEIRDMLDNIMRTWVTSNYGECPWRSAETYSEEILSRIVTWKEELRLLQEQGHEEEALEKQMNLLDELSLCSSAFVEEVVRTKDGDGDVDWTRAMRYDEKCVKFLESFGDPKMQECNAFWNGKTYLKKDDGAFVY